jgi:hypothetical protein
MEPHQRKGNFAFSGLANGVGVSRGVGAGEKLFAYLAATLVPLDLEYLADRVHAVSIQPGTGVCPTYKAFI